MAKQLLIWTWASLIISVAVAKQPEARSPIPAPMRSLPWGQLNFLQTTDTHGWHAGHLQEPQYSADWGDYVSFAQRMREKADGLGVDLLLVDTGDRIEGNGLYDASQPKGKYTYDIFKEQDIDILTTGNHELYQTYAAAREYNYTVPNFKGNYLASNLDYINPKTGEQVPMAQRYRKFTTKNQGIRVTAFGFLFDFTGNGNNTVVQRVEDAIKEPWFQTAIREDVDLFIVAGHAPLDGPECRAIYKAIRSQQWDTPIQFFGGHTHVRNFVEYDSISYGIQGGRYMETIGWMSIEGINGRRQKEKGTTNAAKAITFQRKYIDNNLLGYYYHTGLNASNFPTERGKNVSTLIQNARKALNLDHTFGCAPKDLWLSRSPYPSNDSLLTWLEQDVIPGVAFIPERKNVSRLVLVNSGAMRFDIFKGAFTRDTTFIVSPFSSKFKYIKDVPHKVAKRVLPILNSNGPIFESAELKAWKLGIPEQNSIHPDITLPAHTLLTSGGAQSPILSQIDVLELIPGYTTKDDAGADGDDTIHAPISFYRTPNCIQSSIAFPTSGDPDTVDLVFIDFIQPWIIFALGLSGHSYNASDVESYRKETLTELMTAWIKENWGNDC